MPQGIADIALLGHDGSDELPVLFLGRNEITLGEFQRVGGLVKTLRVVLRSAIFSSAPCICDDSDVPGIAEANALPPPLDAPSEQLQQLLGSRGKASKLARNE